MKKIIALSLLPLAGCMAEPPMEMSVPAQSQLAAELQGRVAGSPQSCVPRRDLRGNRAVGQNAIIFNTTGRSLVYVNDAACPELRPSYAMRTRSPSSQLCAGDIAEIFDPVNGFTVGACPLGRFTPYRLQR